jgi:hypothetical protein
MLRNLTAILSSIAFVSALAEPIKGGGKQSFPQTKPFEKSQYWLGAKGGINFTQPTVDERFTVFEPIDGNYDGYKKEYQSFNKIGTQFQFVFQFSYRRFSIYAAPGYKSTLFTYKTKYKWQDVDKPTNSVELTYDQTQTVEYAYLPLSIKFEFLSSRLRPYIHGGGYIGYKFNAQKTLKISGTDNASGGATSFENQPIIIGATSLFNPLWYGLMGGVGLNYDLQTVRIFVEGNYLYGLNNITNADTRYTENALSGSGDALDNLKLSNVEVSAGVLFPLKFLISGGYKSVRPK